MPKHSLSLLASAGLSCAALIAAAAAPAAAATGNLTFSQGRDDYRVADPVAGCHAAPVTYTWKVVNDTNKDITFYPDLGCKDSRGTRTFTVQADQARESGGLVRSYLVTK